MKRRSIRRSGPTVSIRYRTNRQIRAREVRLIGADGSQIGVVPLQEAVRLAQEANLDLVEVAPDAKPPVCRIEDYKKIVYQKKRQAREARKRQHNVEVKEVRVRPNCDQHDFETKMKRARGFLEKGAKIKLTMMFRGREIATKRDRTEIIKKRVLEALGDLAEAEGTMASSVRTATMILSPTKKTAAAAKAKVDENAAAKKREHKEQPPASE